MLRTIGRTILIIIAGAIILWLGGTTYIKFATDISLKNPLDVFGVRPPEVAVTVPEIDAPEVDNPTVNIETPNINSQDIDTPDISVDVNKPEIEDITITVDTDVKTITLEELNAVIARIEVAENESLDGYNRDDFEKPAKKYIYEGKKLTRNKYAWHISDWLIKNTEDEFTYEDPYTGLVITDMTKIDYDHIVPLYYAYQHGASNWDNDKKNEFSYDMEVGVDVSASANRSKGAKGPSEWLPSANADDYCWTFFNIADKYDLSMSKKDVQVCKLQIMNAISSNEPVELINTTTLEEVEGN